MDGSIKPSFSNAHGETLLGLVHGHWDVEESEINNPKVNQNRKQGVNYGIAIVVPAIKIYETLNRPELVKMRQEQEEAEVAKGIPDTDFAPSKNKGSEHSILTKDEFESVLKKASRKITPDKN